jgi:hypothetical protein
LEVHFSSLLPAPLFGNLSPDTFAKKNRYDLLQMNCQNSLGKPFDDDDFLDSREEPTEVLLL